MSVRAAIERALSPGLSHCGRCRRPWMTKAKKRVGPRHWRQLNRDRWWGLIGVEPHVTDYRSDSGCFPLCESCWAALTIEERLPYYESLIDWWRSDEQRYGLDLETNVNRPLILAAVKAGK